MSEISHRTRLSILIFTDTQSNKECAIPFSSIDAVEYSSILYDTIKIYTKGGREYSYAGDYIKLLNDIAIYLE